MHDDDTDDFAATVDVAAKLKAMWN